MYEEARKTYAEYGIDTEKVLRTEAYRQQGTTLAARGMQKSSWMTSASLHR